MHREPVLRLLRAHLPQATEAHEKEMVAATLRFVEEHADCLLRSCAPGHLTGSAWIVTPDRTRVLLTHHLKLHKWLQLGGHADGDGDLLDVARREALEESGLPAVKIVMPEIFDVDRHWIPPRKTDPGHYHYDLRFLFEADSAQPLAISHESKDLVWVDLGRVTELNPEESIARMVRKTR